MGFDNRSSAVYIFVERWFAALVIKMYPPRKIIDRWEDRAKAAIFFMQFVGANCEKIAVENPVGFMNTAYRKPDQIINPWQFCESTSSEEYVTKATCLWLKGLSKLEPTNDFPRPNNAAIFGKSYKGKNRTWEDTFARDSKARSKTFFGIAKAMADQWG